MHLLMKDSPVIGSAPPTPNGVSVSPESTTVAPKPLKNVARPVVAATSQSISVVITAPPSSNQVPAKAVPPPKVHRTSAEQGTCHVAGTTFFNIFIVRQFKIYF